MESDYISSLRVRRWETNCR